MTPNQCNDRSEAKLLYVKSQVTVCADPAIPLLQKLISCEHEAARARIIISGASSSCSQKIHNLQRGVLEASQDTEYILCLDDDVQLHPGFLQMAVEEMQSDSAAFMLTGTPSTPHDAATMTGRLLCITRSLHIFHWSMTEAARFECI